MFKKIAAMTLVFMLMASVVTATPSSFTEVSATDVNTSVKVFASHVLIKNNGPSNVYILLESSQDSSQVNSTSEFPVQSGAVAVLDSDVRFVEANIICASGETATVEVFSWL